MSIIKPDHHSRFNKTTLLKLSPIIIFSCFNLPFHNQQTVIKRLTPGGSFITHSTFSIKSPSLPTTFIRIAYAESENSVVKQPVSKPVTSDINKIFLNLKAIQIY